MPAKALPVFYPKAKINKDQQAPSLVQKKKAPMYVLIDAWCMLLAQQMMVHQLPLEIKKTPFFISLFLKCLAFLSFVKADLQCKKIQHTEIRGIDSLSKEQKPFENS